MDSQVTLDSEMARGYEPPSMSLSPPELSEVDRAARAYGWEIGRGQSLAEQVETSPDNPFMDPNWRDRINPPPER